MTDRKVKHAPFTFGGDPAAFCEECRLPCHLDEMQVDCHRRFFLQGLVNCSYFVYGHCFLVDEPGCVFDNGGKHDSYWLQLLNTWFHNASGVPEDGEFLRRRGEVEALIEEQITRQNVFLCRYLEEYYNRVMETGGGLGEKMLSRLDDAYLSLLRGISRKTD